MNLVIDPYFDFREIFDASRRQFFPLDDQGAGVWGDPWGFLWAGSQPIVEFERMGRLGKSHALGLEFSVDSANGQWWIDSIAIPYKKKGIR